MQEYQKLTESTNSFCGLSYRLWCPLPKVHAHLLSPVNLLSSCSNTALSPSFPEPTFLDNFTLDYVLCEEAHNYLVQVVTHFPY